MAISPEREPVPSRLTVILTTSPSTVHPSHLMMEEVIRSFAYVSRVSMHADVVMLFLFLEVPLRIPVADF